MAQPVPLHLRNAPTKLMKDLAYGKGYQYAHDEADAVADMTCLPPALEGRRYYEPAGRGFEKEIKRRLDGWEEIKKKRPRAITVTNTARLTRLSDARGDRGFRLVERRHLPQHLGSHRQDEREAVVALHPADRDADEMAALIQHAAARHARDARRSGT